MKKVLIVFTTGFVSWGGLTTVMMNYWRNMNREGLMIDFACSNEPDIHLINEIEHAGSNYYKLPNRKNVFLYFWKLFKLSKGYDIVYVNGNSATSLLELMPSMLAGVKKRYVHNHNSQTAYPLLNKLLMPLFHKSYTKAFACSNLAGEWLFGNAEGYMLIKNAIDVEKFQFNEGIRKKVREEYGFHEKDIVVGHVGKLVAQKNHKFIIQIFLNLLKKNEHMLLMLVGDGVLRSELEQDVKSLGINERVLFMGMRNDTAMLIQAMDIFLFPSIYEGLPLSVLEAQTSGLPCFLSNNITKEVGIGEDVYYLDLCLSPDKWAETINKHKYNFARTERCERNIRRLTSAGYNIKIEADKLRDIYLDIF